MEVGPEGPTMNQLLLSGVGLITLHRGLILEQIEDLVSDLIDCFQCRSIRLVDQTLCSSHEFTVIPS